MLQWDTIAAELTCEVNWYVKQVTAGFSSVREALSVLMLCAPINRWWPFSYHRKMVDLEYFRVLSVFA